MTANETEERGSLQGQDVIGGLEFSDSGFRW